MDYENKKFSALYWSNIEPKVHNRKCSSKHKAMEKHDRTAKVDRGSISGRGSEFSLRHHVRTGSVAHLSNAYRILPSKE